MKASSDRLAYPCYRCYYCGQLLTRIQIVQRWEAAEDSGQSAVALCKCGSRHIVPTNPTLREEMTTPAIWKLWWVEVAKPALRLR